MPEITTTEPEIGSEILSPTFKLSRPDEILAGIYGFLTKYNYESSVPILPLISFKFNTRDNNSTKEYNAYLAALASGDTTYAIDPNLERMRKFVDAMLHQGPVNAESTSPTPLIESSTSAIPLPNVAETTEVDDAELTALCASPAPELAGLIERSIVRSPSCSPTETGDGILYSPATDVTGPSEMILYNPAADVIVALFYIKSQLELLDTKYLSDPRYGFEADYATLNNALHSDPDVADMLKDAKKILSMLFKYTEAGLAELRISLARAEAAIENPAKSVMFSEQLQTSFGVQTDVVQADVVQSEVTRQKSRMPSKNPKAAQWSCTMM